MIIGIDMGHCLSGEGTGAKGCGFKEEVETRNIGKEVITILKKEGHTVINCTVDKAKNNSAQLNERIAKANKQKLDLFVSIHFNACIKDEVGNGKTTGVEVYVHSTNSKAKPYADRILNNLAKLGLKNRGVKLSKDAAKGGIAVVDKTNAPALLAECCFIDDRDDMKLYDSSKFAKCIVEGILNKTISNSQANNNQSIPTKFKNGDYTGKKAKVTTDVLNIRYDRGTDYEVIGKLKKGQVVSLNYCLNGWISIEGYKGNKGLGYVSTDYLELI